MTMSALDKDFSQRVIYSYWCSIKILMVGGGGRYVNEEMAEEVWTRNDDDKNKVVAVGGIGDDRKQF